MDDGVIIGEHSVLQNAISFFSSSACTQHGLHISLRKSHIWWPTQPSEIIQHNYPATLPQSYSEGVVLLQSPIGSDRFVTEHLNNHINGLADLITTIAELDDADVTFTLLRSCPNVSRLTNLLRTTPPHLTSEAATKFDNHMISCTRKIAWVPVKYITAWEMLLPIRSKIASLGAGLGS